MTKTTLSLLFLLLLTVCSVAQTVTFTTQGGSEAPFIHYNVVTEDDGGGSVSVSGTVEIAGPYGYSQSGIVLPNNPTAPGQYLNPVINILSTIYTGQFGDLTRTVTYTFNSSENLYGYTWSGSFTSALTCTPGHIFRGRCSAYSPGSGSGMMTPTTVK